MFNCGNLFSSSSSKRAPLPLDDGAEGHAESGLLLASESEDSLLLASEDDGSRLSPPKSDDDLLQASGQESEILLASDAEDVIPKRQNNQRRLVETTFLGKTVCIHALQALLGIGSSTIQRTCRGVSIHQYKTQDCAQTSGLWVQVGSQDISQVGWRSYVLVGGVPLQRWSDAYWLAEVPEKRDPNFEIRRVEHFLNTLQTFSTDPDINLIGPGTFAGGCRFLQASTRTELFWEYYASCSAKGEDPASYTTFLRVANSILKPGMRGGHLKFRGVNQHEKYNT